MKLKAGAGARRWLRARHMLGLGLLAVLVVPGPVLAQAGGTATKAAPLNLPFERYTLPNGLEVILSPDRQAPVVAVDVWYHVGSRNERAGRTGFAHLFEHMMFQGSANVAKGEHPQLVERAGGDYNGSTTEDRTNYFEVLPANRLNLGLWLEADRMRSLAVTETNLDNQRDVVKEERRLGVDNQAYGPAYERSTAQVPYAASCAPYAHSVIGSMDDLNAAKLEDVQQFFKTYYAPNNATLAVVGDFNAAEAKGLIEQYYGSIPAQAAPAPVACEKPFADLPKKVELPDHNAKLPALFEVYGAVPVGDADEPALRILASILGQGESSRLNQRLVKQERAALQALVYPDLRRGPGVLVAYAFANQGVTADRLQALMDEEIGKLRQDGVTAAELEKAKNQYRAQALRGLQTALGRAERLNQFAVFLGDPALARTDLDRYATVTNDDIKRVANQYLVPGNLAVLSVRPESEGVTP